MHAADDLSVMQTLEALPFITRSVRAICDKPYRIGPSTIPMRQNPYGSRTMDNPKGARIPMANTDPRHNGFSPEAFAMAYIAKVLDAELECLTSRLLTGSFGLLAGKDEPFAADGRRPLFNAVKTLAGLINAEWRNASPQPLAHSGVRDAKTAAGATLWIINITANDQEVDLGSLGFHDALMGGVLTLSPYQATSRSRFPSEPMSGKLSDNFPDPTNRTAGVKAVLPAQPAPAEIHPGNQEAGEASLVMRPCCLSTSATAP